MKPEKFIDHLKHARLYVIIAEHIDTYRHLDTLRELKNLTEYIKFPCNFNDTGICQSVSQGKVGWVDPKNPKCCCADCKNNFGYLDFILQKDIQYYAKNWSTKTGFWRKEKGCILERSKRSVVCVTYVCSKFEFEKGSTLKSTLQNLSFVMKNEEDKLIALEKKKKEK